MKRYFFVFNLFWILTVSLMAQAGQYVYSFLELPVSSHMAALGGANVAFSDDDINFALSNPSLLSSETDNQLALNFTNYIADVSVGSAVYGKNWDGNMFALGLQYIDYGTFDQTSETNESLGTFTAKDYAMSLIYARQLEPNWQVGLSVKPIYSAYESYTSFGLATDLGLVYSVKDKGLSVGASLQNIGRQLSAYSDLTESLPFNASLSFSKKFNYAPFRISVTAHHLQKWDLSYTNTITITSLSGTTTTKSISFIDMLFRHTIFGVDFVPNKNLYLTIGYNHRRARELGLDDLKTLAGFSLGGGLKISKFNIGFAVAEYQKGVMSYQFSLSTGLNSFKK